MWKYHNITINPGQAWTDLSGVRHPKNWYIWSNDDKAKHSITEITEDTRFAIVIPINVVSVLLATTAPTSVGDVPTDCNTLFLNAFAIFIL